MKTSVNLKYNMDNWQNFAMRV